MPCLDVWKLSYFLSCFCDGIILLRGFRWFFFYSSLKLVYWGQVFYCYIFYWVWLYFSSNWLLQIILSMIVFLFKLIVTDPTVYDWLYFSSNWLLHILLSMTVFLFKLIVTDSTQYKWWSTVTGRDLNCVQSSIRILSWQRGEHF